MALRLLLSGMILIAIACKSEKEQKQEDSTAQVVKMHYDVPDGWIEEEPENLMRKAQFVLPGVNGAADAKLTVFVFPSGGGSINANLNRWYLQFKQPDGSNSAEKAEIKNLMVNNLPVTIVTLKGTYLKSLSPMLSDDKKEVPGSALLAAIVETSSAPWFFKAVGPEETIVHWRPSFDQFVNSFSYH